MKGSELKKGQRIWVVDLDEIETTDLPKTQEEALAWGEAALIGRRDEKLYVILAHVFVRSSGEESPVMYEVSLSEDYYEDAESALKAALEQQLKYHGDGLARMRAFKAILDGHAAPLTSPGQRGIETDRERSAGAAPVRPG